MGDKGKSRLSRKPRRGVGLQGEGHAELPGVGIAAVIGIREEDWAVTNRRRIALIVKQFTEGLGPDEEGELQQLQAQADRYLDEVAPLPFEHLRDLEERACLPAADPVSPDGDQADAA